MARGLPVTDVTVCFPVQYWRDAPYICITHCAHHREWSVFRLVLHRPYM